ncbi:hypothetical protein P3T76_010738 [Phytophthora citrophthora]|uniref:Uncharacterized protein n=1 Tax=Phytophthora citrophthora TaxID=4793 RepID=A0AAD9LGU9_9STRA|nr:hypothetical protein P3T76_010738 [Phytophthora citrophthora]
MMSSVLSNASVTWSTAVPIEDARLMVGEFVPCPGMWPANQRVRLCPMPRDLVLRRTRHVVTTWRSSLSEVHSGVRPRLLHLRGLSTSSRECRADGGHS